jgi:hypothetical protein
MNTNQEEQPISTSPEELAPKQMFPVPKNSSLTLSTLDEEEITAQDLLSLVFQLANEDPYRKIEYWIRLKG